MGNTGGSLSADRAEIDVAESLVLRIAAGDSDAESELVARYSRGVQFLLRRLTRGADSAEDLHQETFRVVIERLRGRGLDDPARLSAFVRGTARNLFLGEYRKRARRKTDTDSEHVESVGDVASGQLREVMRTEEAAIVRRVLEELPVERDRMILSKFYLAQEEKSEICDELRLDTLHFNRVLFRARSRFKELLLSRLKSMDAGVSGGVEMST